MNTIIKPVQICKNLRFNIGDISGTDHIPIRLLKLPKPMPTHLNSSKFLVDIVERSRTNSSLIILADDKHQVISVMTTVRLIDEDVKIALPIVIYKGELLKWNLYARCPETGAQYGVGRTPYITVSWNNPPKMPIEGWVARYAWVKLE